jgi:hypothetical protein
MGNDKARLGWRQRLRALVDAGLDAMARYPYDITEVRWEPDLIEAPPEARNGEEPEPPAPPRLLRRFIRVVPPGPPGDLAVEPTPIESRRRTRA